MGMVVQAHLQGGFQLPVQSCSGIGCEVLIFLLARPQSPGTVPGFLIRFAIRVGGVAPRRFVCDSDSQLPIFGRSAVSMHVQMRPSWGANSATLGRRKIINRKPILPIPSKIIDSVVIYPFIALLLLFSFLGTLRHLGDRLVAAGVPMMIIINARKFDIAF